MLLFRLMQRNLGERLIMDVFFTKYFVSYLTYLIKANELTTKKALQTMIEDSSFDDGMKNELLKTLRDMPINDLRELADKAELDGIEYYLENAWSDNPDQTIRNADTSGLEDLVVKVLDIKPNESVINYDYGEGRLLLEMFKAQPTAQLTGVTTDTLSATVAHIKFLLAGAKIHEEHHPRWSSPWSLNPTSPFDKIVELPSAGRGMSSWSRMARKNVPALLSDAGKAIFFVSGYDLISGAWRQDESLAKLVTDGEIESIVLLSDDLANLSKRDLLAMMVMSHHNEAMRLVDATEICARHRKGEEQTLRNIVPKECVDEIVALLSKDSSFSASYSLNEILESGPVVDPQLFPLVLEMGQSSVELSTATVGRSLVLPRISTKEKRRRITPFSEEEKGELLIGAGDIEEGKVVSGLEILHGAGKGNPRPGRMYAGGLSPIVEDNCILIPLSYDEKSGKLHGGEAIAMRASSSGYRYMVDDTILLIKIDEEKADAESIAAFINSDLGQKLMNVALKRSECLYPPEGSGFYNQFSDNMLISVDSLKPEAAEDLLCPRRRDDSPEPGDGKGNRSLFSALRKAYGRKTMEKKDADE